MSGRHPLLITCEHGGNRIPAAYRAYFRGHADLLRSHRGYDPGALRMARDMSAGLRAPLLFSVVSRLLVDLNRSIGHPALYSEATRGAPDTAKREILEHYYLPYRRRAEAWIAEAAASGAQVVHLSCHSFTPEMDGEVRNADVGLLYDPTRSGERALCGRWQRNLKARSEWVTVRRNYPYTGRSDGLTAYLRKRFPEERYLGIELEINQKHVAGGGSPWRELRAMLVQTFAAARTGESGRRNAPPGA